MNAQSASKFVSRDDFKQGPIVGRRVGCFFVLAVLLLGMIAGAVQVYGQRSMEELHRLHQDPKAYIVMLEDPERDAYQKPHEVLMALDLKEGDVVADIGAGSGYFSSAGAACG